MATTPMKQALDQWAADRNTQAQKLHWQRNERLSAQFNEWAARNPIGVYENPLEYARRAYLAGAIEAN